MKIEAEWHMNPGFKKLTDLAKLTDRDVRQMAGKVDRVFLKAEKAVFASEGASAGKKWDPLSAAYAKRKAAKFGRRKILAATGRLRRSLTQNNPEHIRRFTRNPTSIFVGTRVPYAMEHKEGRSGKPRLPKRNPIDFSKVTNNQMFDEVWKVMKTKLDRIMRALEAGARV